MYLRSRVMTNRSDGFQYAFRAAVLAVLCLLLNARSLCLTIYSLEIGQHAQRSQADDQAQSLPSSVSPVFVQERHGTGKPWKVLIGHFTYEVEAWAIKRTSTEDAFRSGNVVSWEWDGRTLESNRLPVNLPFNPRSLATLPRSAQCRIGYESLVAPPEAEEALAITDVSACTEDQLLERGKWGSAEVRQQALEHLLNNYPNSSLQNAARTRLARCYIGLKRFEEAQALLDHVLQSGQPNEKSTARLLSAYAVLEADGKSQAYEAFRAVANDQSLDSEDRLDAMLRVAAIAQSLKDHSSAWLAYSQIENAVDSPKMRAHARMKAASIAFEQVEASKSNWTEVREIALSASNIEEASENDRATAHLMYGETFFKERSYHRCAEEMTKLRQRFPNIKRPFAMALYWAARSKAMFGEHDEAVALYSELGDYPISQAEMFVGLNVKAKGLLEKAKILTARQRTAEAQQAIQTLREQYPNSPEAAAASSPEL